MKLPALALALLLLSSCGSHKSPTDSTLVNDQKSNQNQESILRKQLLEISDSAKGTVGISFFCPEDGDTLSIHGHDHLPTQSVYKLMLSMAVLDQVDHGKLKLDDKIHFEKTDVVPDTHSPIRDKYPKGIPDLPLSEILSATVSQSDNIGCDRLFRLIGGPKVVNDYIHSIGITELNIATTEQEMHGDWNIQYTNWCSPLAMVQILDWIFKKSNAAPSGATPVYLRKLMVETTTGPKRIKGLLPPNTEVAHKTGSGPTNKGITSATNDAGIITLPNGKHLILAVFVSDSKASEEVRERVMAKVAKAVYDFKTLK